MSLSYQQFLALQHRVNVFRIIPEPSYKPSQWTLIESGAFDTNLLTNGNFDDALVGGEVPGWTEVVGTGWTTTASVTDLEGHTTTPQSGSFFLWHSVPATDATISQTVDVSPYAAAIDAGFQDFTLNGYIQVSDLLSGSDAARVKIEYLASNGTTVLDSYDTGEIRMQGNWTLVSDTRTAPSGTRYIKVSLIGHRYIGVVINAFFDNFSLIAESFGSVYTTTFPDIGETWKVTKVKEDLVFLDSAASSDDVSSTLGSFYHDLASRTLYVQTTAADSPLLHKMQIFFKMRFSSGKNPDLNTLVIDDEYYRPRLLPGGLNLGRMEIESIFYGTGIVNSCSVTFDNSDGYFDRYARKYTWKGRLVEIYHGDGANQVDPADEAQVGTFRILNYEIDDRTFILNLESAIRSFSVTLPIRKFLIADYPNMDPAIAGKYIPYLRGPWIGAPCYLIDSGANRWKIADHALDYINQVRVDETAVTRTDDLTNGEFVLDDPVTEGARVVADCGYNIDIDGNGGSDDQLMGSALKDICLNYLNFQEDELDLPSFAALDSNYPAPIKIYIGIEGASAADIIATAERSMFGYVKVADDGKITTALFDPNASTAVAFDDLDFYNVRQFPDGGRVFDRSHIGYDFDLFNDRYSYVGEEDSDVTAEFPDADSTTFDTFLINESDAQALNQLLKLVAAHEPLKLEIDVTAKGFRATIADIVSMTRERGFTLSGAFAGEKFIVREWERDYEDARAKLILEDFFGIGSNLGYWTADSAPAWDDATHNDKDTSGYWTDDDGFADPADASSQNVSAWWR